ncbi:hypothetical protein ACSBR2_016804 [Camellia fascicularis]
MAVKRGLSGTGNRGGSGSRSWMVILVFFSLLAPLIFFVGRGGLYTSTLIGQNDTLTGPHKENIEWRERLALQDVKSLFSKEVIEVITANTDDLVPLSLDFLRKNNLSSSWKIVGVETVVDSNATFVEQNQIVPNIKQATPRGKQDDSTDDRSQFVDTPAKLPRRQLGENIRESRAADLLKQDDEVNVKLENAAIERSKSVDSAVLGKYNLWRKENVNENSDSTVRLMRDQIILARVYISIANMKNKYDLAQELQNRLKESQRALGEEPEKHVFHLVTDKLNFGAMNMWFLLNPPGKATIHVENVDEFKWLNSSYCPVLRQLESSAVKEYYFKADHSTAGSSNLKYRNPKYLSMLNHLRFYLPQVYPKLDKILFLDDDIVVQRDLTGLWSVDLHGKVNGAVETCGESFHRFDKYLNFSNPHIARNFDPNACGWAYGMNFFDLEEWKKKDITGIYHKWQNMNEERVLWKLGTLPPGLITFYGLTHPLNKSWHVLGLGYNPSVDRSEIEKAAVIHYNGNMKPWLELAMMKYRSYWTKYINFDHPYIRRCNLSA